MQRLEDLHSMLLTEKRFRETPPINCQEEPRLHFYHRGDNIPIMTQGIWQVYRGYVQLETTHASGEEVLLGWAKPSAFFGRRLTRLELYEAKALSEVYLRWFFLSEIESSPPLTRLVLTHVSHRLQQTEALLAIAGQRRVEDRLNQLLLLLKAELGQSVAEGTRIPVRLTHQNLAGAIGTTRVTITRLLGKLQRYGYILFDRDRHIIINDDKFAELVLL